MQSRQAQHLSSSDGVVCQCQERHFPRPINGGHKKGKSVDHMLQHVHAMTTSFQQEQEQPNYKGTEITPKIFNEEMD